MGEKIMTTYSLLKTQFSKAFNKVSWSSFIIMKKFGIGTSFTNMILLLFYDAFGSINLNMQSIKSFSIERNRG
jgi:hypothetical protein